MPLPQKINVQRAIRQKLQGMNNQQIADSQGVHRQTVSRQLKPILEQLADPSIVEHYRKNQAQIMDGLAARTVCSISDDDYEKATLQQKIVAVGILTDKSRLIQGQSTSNQAVLLRAIFDADEGE